jgi:hypothetical protein
MNESGIKQLISKIVHETINKRKNGNSKQKNSLNEAITQWTFKELKVLADEFSKELKCKWTVNIKEGEKIEKETPVFKAEKFELLEKGRVIGTFLTEEHANKCWDNYDSEDVLSNIGADTIKIKKVKGFILGKQLDGLYEAFDVSYTA